MNPNRVSNTLRNVRVAATTLAVVSLLVMFAWLVGYINLPGYLPGPLAVAIILGSVVGLLTQ